MSLGNIYFNGLSVVGDMPGIERLQDTTIVVTGATGLIGSAFVDALLWLRQEAGIRVNIVAAGRNEATIVSRFSHWQTKLSVCYFDAVKGFIYDGPVNYIVHAAASAQPHLYATMPIEVATSTVMGGLHALELLVECEANRLLLLSSSEVYGRCDGIAPFREDESHYVDVLDPRSCYPSSKRLVETLCAAYKSEYDIDFVIARPGHVYGPTMTPTDSRAHAQFARDALNGKDILMKSDGSQLRSWIHSIDCATALLVLLTCGDSGNAYNVANSRSEGTVRDLAEAFATAGGVHVVQREATSCERMGFNRMERSTLDAGKLERLGWLGQYDLGTGTRHTIESLRED